MSGSKQSRQQTRPTGFTLIELMIVVAILGVLAAIALPSMIGYVYKSRAIEATSFLAEIRGRQESYRADYGQYCDVSAGSQAAWYPDAAPTSSARPWPAAAALPLGWRQLGAVPPGRMSLFSYSVVAGTPGGDPGLSAARGYNNTDFWFIASALGDLDGDGTQITFEAYSHSKSIFSSVAAGWE